jgi:transcription elongation factor B subunit 2
MDVFLMVRRKKSTVFLDAKETTTVLELKKMIEGITKKAPHDQQLYNKDDTVMEDDRSLSDYGLSSTVAKAQQPAEVLPPPCPTIRPSLPPPCPTISLAYLHPTLPSP